MSDVDIDRFVADRLADAVAARPGPNASAARAMAERASQVLRPAGALSRMDEVATWFAGWFGRPDHKVGPAAVLIFAADHGVASRGVSAYPADVTAAMKGAIDAGVATSSALAMANGATIQVIDVGVGRPTNDLVEIDAMDPDRFVDAWEAGTRAVRDTSADVLILGELGIGNTTAASAIAAAIIGGGGEQWAGRGTGIDDDGLARKVAAVDAGIDRLGLRVARPAQVLLALGGLELVAIAGAATEARRLSFPMILDGFIATAALLPLQQLSSGFLDHAIAGHQSGEQAHQRMLDWLGMDPLLQLDMRLGEASGALVALPVLRSAVAAVLDVATFAEAGVPGPGD